MANIVVYNNRIVTYNNKSIIRNINPLTIANLRFLYSAARHPVLADGTSVPSLFDYSTSGIVATQATGANQALYKLNQFGPNGDKPGFLFDGTNDTYSQGTPNTTSNRAGFSFLVQFKRTTSTSTGIFFHAINPLNTQRLSFSLSATGLSVGVRRPDAGSSQNISIAGVALDTNEHILYGTIDLSTSLTSVYLDGQLIGTLALTGTGNTDSGTVTHQYIGSNGQGASFLQATIGGIMISDPLTNGQLFDLYTKVKTTGFL